MKKVVLIIVLLVGAFFAGKAIVGSHISTNAVKGAKQGISTISPEEFSNLLNSGGYTLLDIRTAEEFNSGHLKNAKNIDYYQTQQFSNYLDSLDKNTKYLIYCRTGHRSSAALKIMQEKGFTNVMDLSGGITAWTSKGLPTE